MENTWQWIVVGIILVAVVAYIIVRIIRRSNSGNAGCGCGCAGCKLKDNCGDPKRRDH